MLEGVPAHEIAGIPEQIARELVTAHQIAPEWHVRMQAAFQANMDNAVSKTVNMPASAAVGEVDQVFRLAYASRCKGITVYVDGSRANQSFAGVKPATPMATSAMRPRGRTTWGQTQKFRMACGTLYVTVNHDEKGLFEVFANLGKGGGCAAQSEATCRMASTALRSGVDPRQIVEQLRGIRCLSTARARATALRRTSFHARMRSRKLLRKRWAWRAIPSHRRFRPACGEKLNVRQGAPCAPAVTASAGRLASS